MRATNAAIVVKVIAKCRSMLAREITNRPTSRTSSTTNCGTPAVTCCFSIFQIILLRFYSRVYLGFRGPRFEKQRTGRLGTRAESRDLIASATSPSNQQPTSATPGQ